MPNSPCYCHFLEAEPSLSLESILSYCPWDTKGVVPLISPEFRQCRVHGLFLQKPFLQWREIIKISVILI